MEIVAKMQLQQIQLKSWNKCILNEFTIRSDADIEWEAAPNAAVAATAVGRAIKTNCAKYPMKQYKMNQKLISERDQFGN